MMFTRLEVILSGTNGIEYLFSKTGEVIKQTAIFVALIRILHIVLGRPLQISILNMPVRDCNLRALMESVVMDGVVMRIQFQRLLVRAIHVLGMSGIKLQDLPDVILVGFLTG